MRRWQTRIFATVWITYFAYYLCRYNMPVAKTRMCTAFSWDSEQIGIVFTALTLMYALGQFVNGQLADRFGTRIIASVGVVGSVTMNLAIFATVMMSDSMFLAGDGVRDWSSFCSSAQEAGQAQAPSPGKRIWTLLPAEHREAFRNPALGQDLDEERKSRLAIMLNGVMKQKALYEGEAFSEVAVPDEAKELLGRDRDDLSKPEIFRLNRLLLAAAYPDQVAKTPGPAPTLMLMLIVVFWGANGFLQAMGWSPMVRVMAHWFPVATRGKIMGAMGTCYQFGAAAAYFLALFLVGRYVEDLYGDWRAAFLVPAVIFAAVGVLFFALIRNHPEDVGLPPVDPEDVTQLDASHESERTIGDNVLAIVTNPYVWIVAWTFFLLDLNRYGFVNWLPAFLDDQGAADKSQFKFYMKRCIHPLAGSAGAFLAGWGTDRFFGGRRAPVIAILLTVLGLSSIVFPYIDPTQGWLLILIVAVIGFCTYGPHILMVGHAAQDFGKKKGAAGAAGFIDGMGYIGASLAGWGAGCLIKIEGFGYKYTFITFGVAAILGALLVSAIWTVRPDMQSRETPGPQESEES